MEILKSEVSLDSFWDKLKTSPENILILDYDGTLSPFTPDRDNALPYKGIRDRLSLLKNSITTEIFIISGRDIKTLKRLLGLKSYPEMWGSHGAERFSTEKGYQLLAENSVIKGLRKIKDWISQNKLDQIAELKPAGCAFHWRGLADKTAQDVKLMVKNYWEPIVSDFGMRLHLFDGGIEIRPNCLDKGTAVNAILSNFTDDVPVAYLGDDLTDEDAFSALGDRGLKILVSEKSRSTSADLQLMPPIELFEFLDNWIQYTSFKQ